MAAYLTPNLVHCRLRLLEYRIKLIGRYWCSLPVLLSLSSLSGEELRADWVGTYSEDVLPAVSRK